MKVFFDCVLTAKDPDKCSTTWQFIYMAEELLKDPDTYIYWGVPEKFFGDPAYPVSPQIYYYPMEASPDRMKEYNRLQPEVLEHLSTLGVCWDWDVLVTVRASLVPQMRVVSTSIRSSHLAYLKKIIIIEDMMVSSKKPTVACSAPATQDRQLLGGYLSADATVIPAFHEKKWVRELALEYLSFAQTKVLLDKVHETSHVTLGLYDYGLKKQLYDANRKFNLAFVGRLEKTDSNLKYINKVFTNQYIMHSDKVNAFVCTVTSGTSVLELEAMEVRHPKREEFWDTCKNEMDLCIGYTVDTELNLSKLEPLLFGVPLIINKADWSVGMLGKDYPFFCNNETECYGWVDAFKENYEELYAIFSKWYEEWFIPTYLKREEEHGMYNFIFKEIKNFREGYAKFPESQKDNQVVKALAEVDWGEGMTLFDAMQFADKEEVGAMRGKVQKYAFDEINLVWATDYNIYRTALIKYYGFEDAGVTAGTLRKVN